MDNLNKRIDDRLSFKRARHRQKKMACQWQFAFQIVTSVVLTGPATTKFWNPRLLLGCHSTAMWDLCETYVFLGAGSWKFLFSGLVCQCMSSCIALLSPEVRWTGLFPWFRPLGCLYVVKWMGSSTHLFSIEMNVEVSTSVVRWVAGGFLLWVHCYFVEVQYWEESEWPVCFTCCLAVFVVSPLCSRMMSFVKFVAFVSRRYILV